MFLPRKTIEEKLRRFLEEDTGQGDITASLTIPEGEIVEAMIVAREAGTVAGIEEASIFVESLGLKAQTLVKDGKEIKPKTSLLRVSGDARTVLSLERTLLNLLSRMSGIATITNRIVKKIRKAGYKTRIACTRKVAPGLGYFDKKAVMLGGGDVHRLHLDDMVLIKDNHAAITGDLMKTIAKAKAGVSFSKKIEVEVSNPEDAVKAVEAGVDIVMLDNFQPNQIKKALAVLEKKKLRSRVLVEASGGINEANVLTFAATGVDILSLGEITQSAKALDIGLEVTEARGNQE